MHHHPQLRASPARPEACGCGATYFPDMSSTLTKSNLNSRKLSGILPLKSFRLEAARPARVQWQRRVSAVCGIARLGPLAQSVLFRTCAVPVRVRPGRARRLGFACAWRGRGTAAKNRGAPATGAPGALEIDTSAMAGGGSRLWRRCAAAAGLGYHAALGGQPLFECFVGQDVDSQTLRLFELGPLLLAVQLAALFCQARFQHLHCSRGGCSGELGASGMER